MSRYGPGRCLSPKVYANLRTAARLQHISVFTVDCSAGGEQGSCSPRLARYGADRLEDQACISMWVEDTHPARLIIDSNYTALAVHTLVAGDRDHVSATPSRSHAEHVC